MSQNLANYLQLPYIGQPYGQPISLCTPRAQNYPPAAVRIDINWALYGASSSNQRVAVGVNLIAQGNVRPALDAIRAVYIDNTFSNVPIYVQFPDTLYTVVCPPATVVMSPVLTNVQQATIFGEGFTDGSIPLTSVQFLNVEQAGYFLPTDFQIAGISTFLQTGSSGPIAQNNFTFVNINLGPDFPGRIIAIVVAFATNLGGGTVSVAQLAGQDLIPVNIIGSQRGVNVYYLQLAGLTIANLAITLTNSMNVIGYGAFTLRNMFNSVPAFNSNAQTASDTVSQVFPMSPGGIGIFGAIQSGGSSGVNNWTGANGHRIFSQVIGGTIFAAGCADYVSLNTQARVIASQQPSANNSLLAGGIWR